MKKKLHGPSGEGPRQGKPFTPGADQRGASWLGRGRTGGGTQDDVTVVAHHGRLIPILWSTGTGSEKFLPKRLAGADDRRH